PVVGTDIGDVKPLLTQTGTGIVIERFSSSAYRAAAAELAEMLDDRRLPERCTQTARRQLSLSGVGVPRYDDLYRFVAGVKGCPACGACTRSLLRRYAAVGLARCDLCGLVYTYRRPSDRELMRWSA